MNHRADSRLRIPVSTLLLLALAAAGASAQALFRDDVPWDLLESPMEFGVALDGMDDGASGWRTVAAGLTAALPAAPDRFAYLRWSHLVFSTDGLSAPERWPEAYVDEADEETLDRMRASGTVSGWGRPEVGYLGRGRLPMLGPTAYAATVWLPFAADAMYPFAARTLTLRLALRREVALGERLRLAAAGGWIQNSAMTEDLFSGDAFAGGAEGAVSAVADLGGWTAGATARFGAGRRGLGLETALPVGPGRVVLGYELSAEDRDGRLFDTRVRVAWSVFASEDEETSDVPPPPR